MLEKKIEDLILRIDELNGVVNGQLDNIRRDVLENRGRVNPSYDVGAHRKGYTFVIAGVRQQDTFENFYDLQRHVEVERGRGNIVGRISVLVEKYTWEAPLDLYQGMIEYVISPQARFVATNGEQRILKVVADDITITGGYFEFNVQLPDRREDANARNIAIESWRPRTIVRNSVIVNAGGINNRGLKNIDWDTGICHLRR